MLLFARVEMMDSAAARTPGIATELIDVELQLRHDGIGVGLALIERYAMHGSIGGGWSPSPRRELPPGRRWWTAAAG
jgi:hypothetical protein